MELIDLLRPGALKQRYWDGLSLIRRYRRGVVTPLWRLLSLPLERSRWAALRALPVQPKHLLMLAWHFPPATNGGVFRPLSFARYAADHGWTLQVFSEAVPPQQWEAGRQLLARLPQDVQVTRYADSRSRAPLDFLPQLDGGLANLTQALDVIRSALRGGPRPSLILASGPPFFNFPLARLLSWLIGVPYVIEYRDEWTLCPHDFVQVGWLDRWAERWSLAGAAHVAFATQAKLDHCLSHYPVFDRNRSSVVPNGWDPSLSEASAIAAVARASDLAGDGVVRLAFAGTLASHACPGPFLATLAKLLHAEPSWRERVQVEFIGHKQPDQQAILDSFPYPGVVHSTGLLSQEAARARIASADILMIFNTADWRRYLQGKFLEYLAVPRPILLYGVGGEMDQLLHRAHSGQAVAEDDPTALGSAIEALARWRDAEHPDRVAVVHSLRRDVIAGQYFRLLAGLQGSPRERQ